MTLNPYFTLTNSNGSLSKHFAVVYGERNHISEKNATIEKTLDGGLDVSMGGIYKRMEYLIRVRDTEDRDGYGTLDDLKTFFEYNNPNGTPSNVIQMTTHTGTIVNVFMVGTFQESLLGLLIEGINTLYMIRATFLVVEENPEEIS